MTFSRGLSTGWLEGTNHPKLTHGKFGKKRGQYCGIIENCGKGWIQLSDLSGIPIAAGDGVVFDAGEDRNKEQGGRVWKIDGDRILFHRKHSKMDWNRIHPGMKIWKTDDPKLNAEVRSLWKNAKLTPNQKAINIIVSGEAGSPLKVSCGEVSVTSETALEVAHKAGLDHATLVEKLGKLGGTRFQLASLENLVDGACNFTFIDIEPLARSLISKLEAEAGSPTPPALSKVSLADLMPDPQDSSLNSCQLSAMSPPPSD